MKCQSIFFLEKNIINLSSAELAQRMVKVKLYTTNPVIHITFIFLSSTMMKCLPVKMLNEVFRRTPWDLRLKGKV